MVNMVIEYADQLVELKKMLNQVCENDVRGNTLILPRDKFGSLLDSVYGTLAVLRAAQPEANTTNTLPPMTQEEVVELIDYSYPESGQIR